jgi:hypothetical protein
MLSHLFGGYHTPECRQGRKSGTWRQFYLKGPTLTFPTEEPRCYYAFAVLESFGLHHLVQRLNGNGVHSLENIITMDMELHRDFDQLELWLEPQLPPRSVIPDCCRVDLTYLAHAGEHIQCMCKSW